MLPMVVAFGSGQQPYFRDDERIVADCSAILYGHDCVGMCRLLSFGLAFTQSTAERRDFYFMRAQFASLSCFSNLKTFLGAINNQYGSADDWVVSAASILLSGMLQAMSSLVVLFVNDQNRGIDRELIARNPYSVYYWGTKIACSVATAALLTVLNLAFLYILAWLFAGNTSVILDALLLLPQMLLSGVALGFVTAVGGWGNSDPYRWSNWIQIAANALSGALIVYTQYPRVLRMLTELFPLAHTLGILFHVPDSGFHDFVVSVLWGVIGILIYRIKIGIVRRNKTIR